MSAQELFHQAASRLPQTNRRNGRRGQRRKAPKFDDGTKSYRDMYAGSIRFADLYRLLLAASRGLHVQGEGFFREVNTYNWTPYNSNLALLREIIDQGFSSLPGRVNLVADLTLRMVSHLKEFIHKEMSSGGMSVLHLLANEDESAMLEEFIHKELSNGGMSMLPLSANEDESAMADFLDISKPSPQTTEADLPSLIQECSGTLDEIGKDIKKLKDQYESVRTQARKFPNRMGDEFLISDELVKNNLEEVRGKVDRREKEIIRWTSIKNKAQEYASAPLCRRIAEAVTKRLPREIRDMVYAHLGHGVKDLYESGGTVFLKYLHPMPEYTHDAYFDYRERLCIGLSSHKKGRYRNWSAKKKWNSLQPTAWLMNPLFVGDVMAKEVTELYYFMLPFSITSGARQSYLSDYLNRDPFKLSIRPYEHIQTLTVSFQIKNPKHVKGFHKKLAPLLSLTRREQLDLHLDVTTANACHAYMLVLLEELRQPVYELMHSGATVTVEHVNTTRSGERRRRRYLTSQGKYLRSEVPIVDCFTLSAEQWEQDVKERRPWGTPEYFNQEYCFSLIADRRNGQEDPEDYDLVENALKERWRQKDIMSKSKWWDDCNDGLSDPYPLDSSSDSE